MSKCACDNWINNLGTFDWPSLYLHIDPAPILAGKDPLKYCPWCGSPLVDTDATQPLPSLEDTQRIPHQFEQAEKQRHE